MTRVVFHNALKGLEDEVLRMGEMVMEAIKKADKALGSRDLKQSKEVVDDDVIINNKRYEIEEKCLLLIATQQPMAVDLRVIAGILHIITDLERIADHAEGTANISLMIGDSPLVKPLLDIPKMADKSLSMLSRCLEAFQERDIKAAREICDEDDVVDDLYDKVYKDLILLMIEKPDTIKEATYLMWAAHNLERTADRVTNIAERVVFMVTGKIEDMNVSKY